MKMDEKKIILYPSNWLYNAGVIGFLKVLEYNKIDFKIDEKILMDRSAIKESYEGIFKYHKEVLQENFTIWGKNKRYPNYIQPGQKEFFKNYYIKALQSAEKNGNKRCSWCEGYFIPLDLLKKLEGKFSGKDFSTFLEQRGKFQGIHFAGLGAAITEVPNSFWNLNFSIPICHLCSYLIIFNHLAFIETSEGEIFINAPHFKLIWDLNRFAENILTKSKEKEYEIRKILGSSLLQWAIKRRALLGAWTMMNIEVIVKKRVRRNNTFENIIDYFDLPQDITKILLDYEIASLIERINEEKIFDLILSGKFSELEKVNYFVLKAILKLKNKEKISENDPIKKYFTNNELRYLQEVSRILPELYAKILKKLEVNMEEKEKEKINGLIEKLKKEGENVNVKEGLAQSINKSGFRLLEQVRLGNKDNVFYILLRCFAANEEKFPDELIEAFKPENEKYFKTLIFSFLAPILGKEETKGGGA